MAPEPFRNQKYKVLKKQLMKEGKLFTDVEFPPADSSLYIGENTSGNLNIEWKRPGDIDKDPRLFVHGVSANDVIQGNLGNCWFVSACSALTSHKTLWSKVIPGCEDQEWDAHRPEKYCGIFHFCFWRFGRWIDVVIDDLLPTVNNKLLFARSRTTNEFWSALLEKAFAKLNGCYESLDEGTLSEAFLNITGGVPETKKISATSYQDDSLARFELFNYLKEAQDMKALMAAGIMMKSTEKEHHLECGLVEGHSYAISQVKRITLDANYTGLLSQLFNHLEKIMMVRLQNPWGAQEWNGAWSDKAPEWNQISKHQQHDLGLKIEEDGQFWMTWEDFLRYFNEITICHQFSMKFFTLGKHYRETVFQGMWWQSKSSRGYFTDRSGGCLLHTKTCLCNPQYRFDIDEDGREIFVSLIQRDIRERKRQGAAYLTIGMMVQRVEENRVYRLRQLLELPEKLKYGKKHSIFLRLKNLKRGRYILIPTTHEPGEEGEFMIRMYSTFQLNAEELTKDKSGDLCSCFRKSYNCVTRLKITGAEFLKTLSSGGVNPYCIVKCEGKSFRSSVCKEKSSPLWDLRLIFIRRYAEMPITIDIWSSNLFKDSFLGRAVLECPVTNDIAQKETALTERKKNGDHYGPMPGNLLVEIATYDNPIHL